MAVSVRWPSRRRPENPVSHTMRAVHNPANRLSGDAFPCQDGRDPGRVRSQTVRTDSAVRLLRLCYDIAYDAYDGFVRDDGWAIASHIALSTLMSLFPFLIFITTLTGFLGPNKLADQVALLLLDTRPAEVAGPI